MDTSPIRLGADIGGTFTDIVLDVAGRYTSTKVLTTYHAPEEAILEGIQIVCTKAGIRPSSIDQIIHGTTLATNALIERRGAKTAFITTKGFRDVIEMRTESRFEQYDLNLRLPDPLLPRNRRYVVEERLDSDGNTLIPLNIDSVHELAQTLKQARYESIAIGLLHAYTNPSHEQQIHDILADYMPDVMISLSSEVSPQMREYERFNTTIANAYIKPLMKSYLDRLKERLDNDGVSCPVFLIHSGGGIISLESAAEFPVRLVESGPAGGAVFAANIAAQHKLAKALSFDMGGTTAKICLIQNHTPKTARVFEVARSYRFKKGSGMPISIPVIDMVEIGAGGGSLAHIDELEQIRIGPESAGSEPGPACYNNGGNRPTVTDADLILGKLDPDHFAGGAIPLHQTRAEEAIDTHIRQHINLKTQDVTSGITEITSGITEITSGMTEVAWDITEAAWGMTEVVDENMANAARVHAVENGEDLSEYTMIAFGGAAPLHAARLCEKLGISRCLIPKGAGVGSAIGFLKAPFSFEVNKSVFMPLKKFEPDLVKKLFQEMYQEATDFVLDCNKNAVLQSEYKAYMRYKGQGWEIPVNLTKELAENPDADAYLNLFHLEYKKLFSRTVEGIEVEITVWSVNAFSISETNQPVQPISASREVISDTTRSIFDTSTSKSVCTAVIRRDDLEVGAFVKGPAMIVEDETTIILPSIGKAHKLRDETIEVNLEPTHNLRNEDHY